MLKTRISRISFLTFLAALGFSLLYNFGQIDRIPSGDAYYFTIASNDPKYPMDVSAKLATTRYDLEEVNATTLKIRRCYETQNGLSNGIGDFRTYRGFQLCNAADLNSAQFDKAFGQMQKMVNREYDHYYKGILQRITSSFAIAIVLSLAVYLGAKAIRWVKAGVE